MISFDENKLEELLEAGKYEEAGELISQVLASDITEEEKGAAYANFALLYMQIINRINKSYEDSLDQSINVLQELDKKAKQTKEKLKQGIIKKKIKDM